MSRLALHVTRAFSAQPTLGAQLGPDTGVIELPLPEALATESEPDLVWASNAAPSTVAALRARFPAAGLLVTVPSSAGAQQIVELIGQGADLVLRDEGVLLVAAALTSLNRRASAPRRTA